MDIQSLGRAIQDYGLAAALAIAMVLILILVLRWVFKMVDGILEQAKQERIAFVKTIEFLSNSLKEHNERASSFHESVKEAHNYQREEHVEHSQLMAKLSLMMDEMCVCMRNTNIEVMKMSGNK